MFPAAIRRVIENKILKMCFIAENGAGSVLWAVWSVGTLNMVREWGMEIGDLVEW